MAAELRVAAPGGAIHDAGMDFMKWLNSLDELLYEVMSWLLFFPITLWRSAIHPFRTMEEIEAQTLLPDDQQYAALLSPPLFLALALLLAHAVSTALGQTDAIVANQHGLASLVSDNFSALVLRVVVFAAFPLFLAARLVRGCGMKLDRVSLRQPFYEQCYPAAVFALGLSLGTSLALVAVAPVHLAGRALIVASIIYFFAVETRWFAMRRVFGLLRAFVQVALGLLEGAAFMLLVGFLLTR